MSWLRPYCRCDGLEKVIPLKIALFGIYVSFQGCRLFFQLKHPPNPKITEKLFHKDKKDTLHQGSSTKIPRDMWVSLAGENNTTSRPAGKVSLQMV